jgi:hypothetical protein
LIKNFVRMSLAGAHTYVSGRAGRLLFFVNGIKLARDLTHRSGGFNCMFQVGHSNYF